MALAMTSELWRQICEAAAQYPTCTLKLFQHQGFIKSFTVEHRMGQCADTSTPPHHVKSQIVMMDRSKNNG